MIEQIGTNELSRANEFQKEFFSALYTLGVVGKFKLVIMAPTTKSNGFRIYKNGGLLAEVKKTKVTYLSDKHSPYIKEATPNLNLFYKLKKTYESNKFLPHKADEKDFLWFIEICSLATKKWSEAEKQTHEEREMETEIISAWRDRGLASSFLMDMEFNVAPWKQSSITHYGKAGHYVGDISKRGGRVDLVVYDSEAGFGFVELKYDCASMRNLGKHFADFDGVKNNTKKAEIIKELTIRLASLSSIGACNYSLETGIVEKIWFGFLLLGKSKKEYIDEMVKKENWICQETNNKKTVFVDWLNIKSDYEKGIGEAGIVWYKNYNQEEFSIQKKDFKSFDCFIGISN